MRAPYLSQSRILIIDDSRLIREYMRTVLEKHGCKSIYEAPDGVDALEKSLHLLPSAVVLDLCMPRMDGYAFCREMRAREQFNDTPIIVVTGTQDEKARMRAFESGASDFLNKPITEDEFIKRCEVHCEYVALKQRLRAIEEERHAIRDLTQHMPEHLVRQCAHVL